MTVELTPRGTLSEEALRELEEKLGFALPAEYRAWLAATNGADFPVAAQLMPRGLDPEDDLYGHRTGGDRQTELLYAHGYCRDVLTLDYLPVTRLTTGIVAIKVTEPECGSLWYWSESTLDTDEEYTPEYISTHLLRRVADTFAQFLELWEIDPTSPFLDSADPERTAP
ncbi:SMI1/KNR4 family protein [Embleya scabrispora]|uniref:SMI1/KNR4 family protein n=1 Tax=Embleya scabrispora TaxID=159449 RepID=UPI00137499F0|nr:SMI1/KNR4 family protein [Embleya scabrispora]